MSDREGERRRANSVSSMADMRRLLNAKVSELEEVVSSSENSAAASPAASPAVGRKVGGPAKAVPAAKVAAAGPPGPGMLKSVKSAAKMAPSRTQSSPTVGAAKKEVDVAAENVGASMPDAPAGFKYIWALTLAPNSSHSVADSVPPGCPPPPPGPSGFVYVYLLVLVADK